MKIKQETVHLKGSEGLVKLYSGSSSMWLMGRARQNEWCELFHVVGWEELVRMNGVSSSMLSDGKNSSE